MNYIIWIPNRAAMGEIFENPSNYARRYCQGMDESARSIQIMCWAWGELGGGPVFVSLTFSFTFLPTRSKTLVAVWCEQHVYLPACPWYEQNAVLSACLAFRHTFLLFYFYFAIHLWLKKIAATLTEYDDIRIGKPSQIQALSLQNGRVSHISSASTSSESFKTRGVLDGRPKQTRFSILFGSPVAINNPTADM